MRKFVILVALWAIAQTARPQEMVPVWAKSFGGPGWDMASTLCVTPSGNVIVAGTFSDSIYFEGQNFYSSGYTDVVVAGYTKEGETTGAFTLGGIGNDRALFSGYGNSMVLLIQYQNGFEMDGTRIDSAGLNNYVVGWFDEKGSLTGHTSVCGTGTLQIGSMNCNSDGSVNLTGSYTDTLRIDGKDWGIAATETPLLLTLQENGKSKGMKALSDLDNRQVFACTGNQGNKMLIAGTSPSNDTADNAKNPKGDYSGTEVVADDGYRTLFTAVMNQGGNISDIKTLVKGIELQPVSVVTARQSTWVASRFKYNCLDGADTLKAKGQHDILLAKIPEKGDTQLWTIGGYADDQPLYLKASGDQAILAGYYSDTIWFGEDNILVAQPWGSDLFMAVFEDEQMPVKTLSIGGLYNDFPCAMETSDAGVYLFGQFKDTLMVGKSVIGSAGSYDLFVARLENCGAKTPVEIFATAVTDAKGGTGYQLSVKNSYTSYQWSDGLGFGTTANVDKAKKYSIEAIDLFGCKCTGEINLASLKSALIGQENNQLSNAQQAEFKLYPTVTSGLVYWQPGSKFPQGGATLRVYDAKGSAVLVKEYPSQLAPLSVQTLSMGRFVPGQYLVSITGNGYKESVKVIMK